MFLIIVWIVILSRVMPSTFGKPVFCPWKEMSRYDCRLLPFTFSLITLHYITHEILSYLVWLFYIVIHENSCFSSSSCHWPCGFHDSSLILHNSLSSFNAIALDMCLKCSRFRFVTRVSFAWLLLNLRHFGYMSMRIPKILWWNVLVTSFPTQVR